MKKHLLNTLFMCHRIPSRSFFYKGKQFPICSRCTGILIGYILGTILLIIGFIIPTIIPKLWIAILLIVPMGLDGFIQLYTSYESTNIKRLITGILGGFGIIFIVYYTAVFGYQAGQEFRFYLNKK